MQHLYSPLLLIVFVFRTLWLEFHSHNWKPIWLDGSEETLFADCWRGECHYKEQHLVENDDFCFHRVTRSFVVRSAEERYYWLTLGTATEYPRGKLDRLQETRHSMRQSKKHTKANAPRLWKFVTLFFLNFERTDQPTQHSGDQRWGIKLSRVRCHLRSKDKNSANIWQWDKFI